VGDDGDAVELTIEPGTIVYGNPSTRGTLAVSRGSRLIADGTAAAPIVFTSPRAPGARRAGDWGGVAIDGYAPVNGCPDAPCVFDGEGGTGRYGGDRENDDSGVLRYVRIEFAGALYSPEDELNSLALQGVGRGTVIDHLQLHVGADDGIEFFGGTVDVRHVLVTGASDDSFDWTSGWRGHAQFVGILQHPDSGDHALEADNNELDFEAEPRSLPTLANFTMVGRIGSGTGALFRRGTGVALSNSIVEGFGVCVDVVDDATWTNGYAGVVPSGELVVAGTWLDCGSAFSESAFGTHSVQSWLETDNPANVFGPAELVDPSNLDRPDLRLLPTSAALDAALPPLDDAIDAVDYVGAFDAVTDWTTGWTTAGTN
ncbi:MAG: hypothetical protein ABMB14_05315, partial [Myxococcota bacterium]